MYSLNQVKKLVSCGRDPARSLPFWRGFLLIPLILVWLAFTPNAHTTPDPGFVGGSLNTADGDKALGNVLTGLANGAFGWFSLSQDFTGSFNTGVGAGTLALNHADANTAVGTAALILNVDGSRNTACGVAAMVNNAGDVAGNGSFNGAVGAFALNGNTTGFSNNAMGDSALELNTIAAVNTAVGDLALRNNDATGSGQANNNVAVGGSTMFNNVTGSENTVVGTGAGPNLAAGFNNTYVGNFVGSVDGMADEDSTIRIGDISNGNGAGSTECFIGGIWNNVQPVGGSVVVVTLNLDDDHLGYDPGAGVAPTVPHRNTPQPRMRPQAGHQAMLNQKVEKLQATVAQQQATVEQQQKQIETLTAQLREQAAQIQQVSAQVEMIRPTPRVVNNH